MKIYLAGPIFQCADHECVDWRQEATKRMNGHEILDPMKKDYRGVTDEKFREIVERDKALIDRCDVLLVNHSKPSVGTSMEILYAWEKGKEVILISEDEALSPWLLYHSNKVFHSLEDAIVHLNRNNTDYLAS